MRYVFINPDDMQNVDPYLQYNTRVVRAYWDQECIDYVCELEFLGTVYDPKNPQCLFPVSDNAFYHVHPFVD